MLRPFYLVSKFFFWVKKFCWGGGIKVYPMLSPKCEVVNFLLSTGLYFTKGSPQKVSDQSAKKCVKFGHKQKCDIYCHKQRGTLWLGTCPNPPPPPRTTTQTFSSAQRKVKFYKYDHDSFPLWQVITHSVCFELLIIVLFLFIIICVYDDVNNINCWC